MSRKTWLRQLITPCFCLLLAWLASAPFIESVVIRMILTVPGVFLLLNAINHWRTGRRMLTSREHFKWFLELLLTRLSSGASLERAISDTLPGLSQLLGRSADLLTALKQLEQQLSAGQPLEILLPSLSRSIHCPEARIFFQILPELRRTGGKIDQYVRQHLQMVTEQLALQQDLNAETTQRQTEAMILALMPFALAALLEQSYDAVMREALATTPGVAGMLAAYILAMLAAAITLSALGLNPSIPSHRRTASSKSGAAERMLDNALIHLVQPVLHRLYRDLLPETYGSRLLKMLYGQNEDPLKMNGPARATAAIERFFLEKAAYILISLAPALVFTFTLANGWIALLVLPVVVCIAQDQKVFQIQRQQMTEHRLIYPIFLNLCAALLQSGLTLHKALQTCLALPLLDDQTKTSEKTQSLPDDLVMIRRLIQTGRPADQAVEMLAAACPIPEAQAAMLLMQRYDRYGGNETLQMLSMQAAACWSLYRNTIRKQMEHQSLRLLMPMMLDLLAVILTALLPAVLSIRSL